MKRLSTMIIAIVLVAVSAVTAFAAGINSYEQAVLDELQTSVNGMTIPSQYINQAENYFNTVEMTKAESDQIIAAIKEGKAYLESTGVTAVSQLTADQKQAMMGYANKAAGVLGLSLSYGKGVLTVTDGNKTNGNTSDNKTVAVSGNVVKTTGADVNYIGFAVLGAVVVLFAACGTIYLVKTKKEA